MSISQKLSELDQIISRLRYVKRLDLVLSSDHNDLVDAVKKIREILDLVQQQLQQGAAAPAFEGDYSSYDLVVNKRIELPTPANFSKMNGCVQFTSGNDYVFLWLRWVDTDGNYHYGRVAIKIPDAEPEDIAWNEEECSWLRDWIAEQWLERWWVAKTDIDFAASMTRRYVIVNDPDWRVRAAVWKDGKLLQRLDLTDIYYDDLNMGFEWMPSNWAITLDAKYITYITIALLSGTAWLRALIFEGK